MDDNVQKKPKKRGRKPKNVLNQTTEKKKENKIVKNLIIKLDTSEEVIENISGYGDEIINHEIKNNDKSKCVCWNCCHDFHETINGLQLKYVNKIFYTLVILLSRILSKIFENFKINFFELSYFN